MSAPPLALDELIRTGHRNFEEWRHDDLRDGLMALRDLAVQGSDGATTAQLYVEIFEAQLALRADDFVAALRHLSAARALGQDLLAPSAQADLLLAGGYVLANIDEIEPALADLERAWSIIDNASLHDRSARCALLLGRCFAKLEQLDAGEQWLRRAVVLAADHGPASIQITGVVGAATVLNIQGDNARNRGDLDTAQALWREALAALEALVPMMESTPTLPYSRATWLTTRAETFVRLGHREEARAGLQQLLNDPALGVFGDQCAFAQAGLVDLLFDEGRLDEAREACLRAIDMIEAARQHMDLERMVLRAADIAEAQLDHVAAVGFLRRALKLRRDLAVADSQMRAQITAVKLDTERARALAAAEHERASRLDAANSVLREQAAALTQAAQRDPLTGLANRRLLDLHLQQIHADAAARHVPLCVAMIDVDYFKRVNDTHGHAVGDAVLRRMADMLPAQCRDGDLVARYGGEEFVIVFRDIGLRRAREACERIRQHVEHADWRDLAPQLSITVSLGVADISEHPSPTDGLSAADQALYAAKSAGRNQIAVADQTL